MTPTDKAERFQALHRDGCFIIPNAWDAGSARILMATDLPVSADLEDGYGADPAACAETVRRAAEAGLCGSMLNPVRSSKSWTRATRDAACCVGSGGQCSWRHVRADIAIACGSFECVTDLQHERVLERPADDLHRER